MMQCGPEFDSPPFGWVGIEDLLGDFRARIDGEVKQIVELGVYWGYSLFCWSKMYPHAKVIGIDSYLMHDAIEAQEHVMKYMAASYPNVQLIIGDTQDTFHMVDGPIDILHIDASHRYDNVKADYELWSRKVRPGGVIFIHDIKSDANVGTFFNEIQGNKDSFPECNGMGAVFV